MYMDPSPMRISTYVVLLSQIMFTTIFTTISSTSAIDLSTANLIRVDQSGRGDFRTIQEAIDSVPSNNSQLVFIKIKPGTYREQVRVEKPFITLSGTSASNTIITTTHGGGDIMDSAALIILTSDFIGRQLTIQNTYGNSERAVALKVSGDRNAFYGCRILSYQDTLLDNDGTHYYSNCYIEGATDFICGNGASIFEKCHLHSTNPGFITAQKRSSPTENTGFVFLGGRITGVGKTLLGRPWGPYSRVVFAQTYMADVIQPVGWNDWFDPEKQKTVLYGEYECSGPGSDRSGRVSWSRKLTNNEASPFLTKQMIGGGRWLRGLPTYHRRGDTLIKAKGNMR